MRNSLLLTGRPILLICLAAATGCGRGDAPTAKYFSGEPVAHWLEAANAPDPKVRKKAVEVLGNVGPVDPGAIPALIAAVKDRQAAVRDAAVLALSKIGPPAASAMDVLTEAAKDRDATIRAHARSALERIGGR